MALSFGTPETELSITLHNRRPTLIDNIFKGTVFLGLMKTYNGIEMVNGGLEMVDPIRMAKSTAVGSFDGYDILDVTPQDSETSTRYPWSQEYASITLPWTQEMKNQGEGKLLDILKVKSDDASLSLRDDLNSALVASPPAAGSKDPISITEIIQDDPTVAPARVASIGNISGATNAFWRNKTLNGGAFSVADWGQMYNDVSDGSEPPTFILTSQTVYQYYENSQVGMIRYGSDSRVGDLGFQNLLFKTRPVVWDPLLGITDNAWFINTNYLKLAIMRGADFVTSEFVKPSNQMARTAQLVWMGNLKCNNRRRQGVVFDILAPA